MGQKINPTGYRIGVTLPWMSRWTASKTDFPKLLVEDAKIRRYLTRSKEYENAGISRVDIERSGDELTVIISTARPGMLIGRKGKNLDKLKEDIERVIAPKKLNVKVNINELARPDLDARIVATAIKEQLEKRTPFRKALKKALAQTMERGAEGVKIRMAGRLGGAEMARVEIAGVGRVPLTTLDADISYALGEASTTYGQIGIKVWINRGSFKKQAAAAAN